MSDHGHVVDPGTVRLERTLPGPLERVWAFLTVPEKRKRWLAAGDFDLRVGGAVTLLFDYQNLSAEKQTPEKYKGEAGARLSGRVVAYEPPRLLTITWMSQGEESEVSFELSKKGDDVQLVVTHRRLHRRDAVVNVAAGWHAHLGILDDVLHDKTPRGFWSTHAALEREYEDRMQVMEDYWRWSTGVEREVRDHGGLWSSIIRRQLDAPIERVWAAWTDPEMIPLWFGKPSGAFKVGGTVELDLSMPQKTTVKVLVCVPPERLRTTWKYGDWPVSEVELRLSRAGKGTRLELEHFSAPTVGDARGTGSGWEVALLHLDRWLHAREKPTDVMYAAMDAVWNQVGSVSSLGPSRTGEHAVQ